MTIYLSTRYQCPLCFDVLRLPIKLPCCQRHLCKECFERALEITSSQCGFCRKRIVGLARKKQTNVDEQLWQSIKALCPSIEKELSGVENEIEFRNEDCENRISPQEMNTLQAPKPGELKEWFETQSRQHRLALKKIGKQSESQSATGTNGSIYTTRGHGSKPIKRQGVLDSYLIQDPVKQDSDSMPSGDPVLNHNHKGSMVLRGNKCCASNYISKEHVRKSTAKVSDRKTLLRRKASGKIQMKLESKLQKPKDKNVRKIMPRRQWRCSVCTFDNNCFDTCCSMCLSAATRTRSFSG